MEAVEPAPIAHQARPLRLEDLPDRLVAQLGVAVRLGVGDALVQEPGRRSPQNGVLFARLITADEDQSRRTFFIAWGPVSRRRRREIIMPTAAAGAVQPIRRDEQGKLLRAIGQGRRWTDELIEGTCADIAALAHREKRTERSVRMMLSLAFLDPTLVKAAAEARLPRGYGSSRLVDLPMHWPNQWQALGLRRPA